MTFKSIFFVFIAFFAITPIFGQDKTTIGIIPMNKSSGLGASEKNGIEDAITNAFQKAKHFNLVDRSNIGEVNKEKQMQKSEDFFDGKTVEQGKSLGAQYLIGCTVSSYKNDGSVCKFNLALNVIDVSTGQITNNEIINVQGGTAGHRIAGALVTGMVRGNAQTGNLLSNKDKALQKALDDVADEIDAFVAKNFPLSFTIVEVMEKINDVAAKKVLIAGGSASGIKKGDLFKVVETKLMDVDGKKIERKKVVARMEVSKVEDENFSRCIVTNEDNDLVTRFNNKQKLRAVTDAAE